MKKEYTQIGTFIIASFAPTLLLLIIPVFMENVPPKAEIILILVAITFLICLLIFYKLTISIDKEHISFKFGMGWIKKNYPFSEIESCVPVRNKWYYGIGIRFLGNGWLYNVSGFEAVELRFKNSKSVVRIGTNKPTEICEAVRGIIGDR